MPRFGFLRPTCSLVLLVSLTLLVTQAPTYADEVVVYQSSLGATNLSLGTKVGGNVASSSASILSWDNSLGVNFTFPRFSPSLGTLTGVFIFFEGAVGASADILFVNNQPPPFNFAGINFNLRTTMTLTDATGSAATSGQRFLNETRNIASNGTPFNFPIGSGTISGPLAAVPSSAVSDYVGTGNVTLALSILFRAEATTSNGGFAVTPLPTIAVGSAGLAYSYAPAVSATNAPEPSTGCLWLAASLVTIARRVRKRADVA